MDYEIKVPEVAEGVTEGTVIAVSVAVGDQVEYDQTLLELETDKAVVAIPSPVAGVVKEILVAEGDQAKVDATIILLDTQDESAAAGEDTVQPEEPAVQEEPEETIPQDEPEEPVAEKQEAGQPAESLDLSPVRRDDRVAPAAPSVRRLARDLGVDIYQVQGSGPGGRISSEDVRLFVRDTMRRVTGGGVQAAGEFAGLHAQRPLPDFSKWGEVSREPLSRVREVTADAMAYAWSTVPMVTQYDKAVIGDLETYRKEHNRGVKEAEKVTMTAILAKVCATALKAFPQFNSSLDLGQKELVLKQYVHIGVAVDTPNGLLVPVLRDAAGKGIEQLAVELNELAERTRERKVLPEELEGGSFTISNLGGIGGNAFTPIVYAPQVAILGVSRAEVEPVWSGQEFESQLVMPLSLSYDHRVIDGAQGARFLRWICRALEQPIELAMKS
ncbi:pyruvate dehydrogenase E2 component (dihydrolipoamide acetyltransferase) [Malonomonas rubra DSM 5091]|uniref:Dihydrolipoamide acetyltransferase component of pyruvate dehydrogenase complex n=1 Tax=Malonomonas rubra DSM 5091 TaxID=1122189 RepID=A0A1M6E564_MALRU|nr:2-oxo acid dehydrogenase subunit E2 [Malonomonas rubra]SHI80418.1 pyruvate dehydrogenase E2 component (dihydrolipoamide acetyltransferase) [Malonomonas rubra DSM 5091]